MRIAKHLETLETWKLCSAFALLGVLPYLAGIQADFVFDDQNAILGNSMVTGDFDLLAIFQHDFWGLEASKSIGSYRPLTVLTFTLDYRTGDGAPWAFHLSNLLFHGIACASIFAYLANRFDRNMAALATSFFAVHALHTENVLAIVGRADVLATILVIATLAIARGSSRRAWLAGPAFFAALLSKEVAVAALAILAADLLLNLDPESAANRRSRLISLGAMLLAFTAYMLLRHYAMGLVEAPVRIQGNSLLGASPQERLYTACALITRAMGLLLLPWTLIADYSSPAIMPESSLLNLGVLLGLLLSLGSAVAIWTLRIRQPAIAWGLVIIGASYIPVSNLLVLVPTIFAERLLYLPSLGFCVVLAQVLTIYRAKARLRLALSLLIYTIIAFNMVRASIRTSDWLSDRDLFASAVASDPISLLSRLRMGNIERLAGNLDAAAYQFDQAIKLAPNYGDPYSQLGIVLDLSDSPEQAHILLRQAMEVTPQCAECATALVTFYLKYGRFEAAESEINKLEAIAPNDIETILELRARLGEVRRRSGEH